MFQTFNRITMVYIECAIRRQFFFFFFSLDERCYSILHANGMIQLRREKLMMQEREDICRNKVLEKVKKNRIQGRVEGLASVKSRNTSSIIIGGGLSIS